MAIQSDPSLEGFNSFASQEEADAYYAGFYFGDHQSWEDVEDNQERLLITAFRKLIALPWGGRPYDASQTMAFPRYFIYDDEYGWNTFDSQSPVGGDPAPEPPPVPVSPEWLKAAQLEWAFWMWTEGDRPATDAEFAQLKASKVGPLDYTFRDNTKYSNLPPSVLAILQAQGDFIIDLSTGPRSMGITL
jgi:hypothetical protein